MSRSASIPCSTATHRWRRTRRWESTSDLGQISVYQGEERTHLFIDAPDASLASRIAAASNLSSSVPCRYLNRSVQGGSSTEAPKACRYRLLREGLPDVIPRKLFHSAR